MNNVMLTTIDNPYDPFENFTSWWMYDVNKGYNSCAYLARIIQIPEDSTQEEEDLLIEQAIDSIIKLDFMDIYKKIKKNN